MRSGYFRAFTGACDGSGPDVRQFCLLAAPRLALLSLLAIAPTLLDAAPPDQPATDRRTRDEAVRSIPFERMTEQVQGRVWDVVSKPSFYRRLPIQTITSDPDMYLFLIRYPETMVNMWQLMGITQVQIQRTGPYTFSADDGQGTTSDVELVYGTHDLHVFLATGTYEGALLRRDIKGRCVLVLSTDYQRAADKTIEVTTRLDVFVKVDNTGIDLLARTLHPIFGKAADYNFAESTRFMGQVSHAAETKGDKMQQLAARLTEVSEPVRARFAQVSHGVHQRAVRRAMANNGAVPR